MAARYTRLPSFRGGIELHTAASRVTASHTIFTGPGEDPDCYCFNSAGQMMNRRTNTLVDLQRTLMQRAITCGELDGSMLIIDRSALIGFPGESGEFADEDNDSIYLTNGDLTVSNTEIGYNKDDGIDSGGNGGQDPYTPEDDIAPLVCVVQLIGLPGISGLI